MVDVGVQRRLVARDLETDKLVAWAVLRVLQQGPAAVEVALVEVDQAAGAQLEGRAAAGRPNGGLRRLEIGAADDEAGLDAREVERGIADRPEAIVVPRGPEAVPQGKRLLGRRPQLGAQIAGEAGAREDRQRVGTGRDGSVRETMGGSRT